MTSVNSSKMLQDSKRRVLKDNSWIKRGPEEDEPVDDDPNFGKTILGRPKSEDTVDSKPVEVNQTTPVSAGSSVSSLTKKFGGSQDMLNKTSSTTKTTTTTKSTVATPTSPTKPPVPTKSPVLKTSPNVSSFTARVFSGANTNNKTVTPVKTSFGDKPPASPVSDKEPTNGVKTVSSAPAPSTTVPASPTVKTASPAPAPSTTVPASPTVKSSPTTTPVKQPTVKTPTRTDNPPPYPGTPLPPPPPPPAPVPVSSPPAPSTTSAPSPIVKSDPVTTPALRTSTSENKPLSTDVSTSSVTSTKTTIINTKTTSPVVEESWRSSTKYSTESIKTSENKPLTTDDSTSSVTSTRTTIINTKTTSPVVEESWRSTTRYSTESIKSRDEINYSTRTTTSSTSLYSPYDRKSGSLDDLADTLIPTYSGTVYSEPTRTETYVKTIDRHTSLESPTPRSPLNTTFSTSTSTRAAGSRDACTVCGKPMGIEPKMILEDLKIFSHASCFKCSQCYSDLGNLEAGESIWVYKEKVNCENCFSKTKGQWYR